MAISLRLPADVEDRLDRLARATGRSKTFYATQAICEHIEDLEDYYEAEAIKGRIDAGLEQTIPLSQVMADYGLDH